MMIPINDLPHLVSEHNLGVFEFVRTTASEDHRG